MNRILSLLLDKKNNLECGRFASPRLLFEGLAREEAAAIRCLFSRVSGSIFRECKKYDLPDEDIEELLGDCITFLLLKIRDGAYVFQGFDPATYVVEVAKNKARTFQRARLRARTEDLENSPEPAEPEPGTLADAERLENLLRRLSDNCQKLIRLKYLEERPDKEAVAQKLTQYTTVDALKNYRARCMKTLAELAHDTFDQKPSA